MHAHSSFQAQQGLLTGVPVARANVLAEGAHLYGLLEESWTVPATAKKRRMVERSGVRSTSRYRGVTHHVRCVVAITNGLTCST